MKPGDRSATEGWNLADIFEHIAAAVPDRPCQIQGDRVVTWGEFDRRATALAADLLAAGLSRASKVACYLYNCPEYLEALLAAVKVACVPVNTNYRYGAEEILYLFDNADAEAVVFHASFSDIVEQVRTRLPMVKRWYCVSDAGQGCPPWAVDYETVVGNAAAEANPPWERSGDDILLLYTGGTTGLPKGVMWRQDDLVNAFGAGGNFARGVPPAGSVSELVQRARHSAGRPVRVVAAPLMHGTGQFSALMTMSVGGSVVSLVGRSFDVAELFDTVERTRATAVTIVGVAHGGPMLAHLDERPGRYDLSRLTEMLSSGVMWPQENKAGLLRHAPDAVLFDSYGSSEAIGVGRSLSSRESTTETATFALGADCAVFTDDGRRVEPGSGEIGLVAIGGPVAIGYYKDPSRSAKTFPTIDGRRWSVPGDFAEVAVDGTLRLLGRGSSCINTGGEKVYPEEVEEVLRSHPAVQDVVVVGLPDERFGETICAVVEPSPGEPPTLETLAALTSQRLAAFKAPRRLIVVDSIGRAPNGKVDHRRLKQLAAERLAVVATPDE